MAKPGFLATPQGVALANTLNGATLNAYLGGTTTGTNFYSDKALTTSIGTSLTADSTGRFANFFLPSDLDIKLRLIHAATSTDITFDYAALSSESLEVNQVASTLENVAALRLKAWTGSERPLVVCVQYAFVAGDAAGWYRLDAADTTTSDDGLFTIVDAASNRWKRIIDSAIPLRGANVATDLSANAATALAAALNGSSARPVEIGIGQFRTDATITIADHINLRGLSPAAGPGNVLNSRASQIAANFLSGNVLSVGPDLYGSHFENLQFNSNVGQRTGGHALYLDGSGLSSAVANWRIDDCAFNGQYYDIGLYVATVGSINRTYHQAFTLSAIRQRGDGVNEPAGGWWTENYIFGDTSASVASTQRLIDIAQGYTDISQNLLLGGAVAVYANINEYPAGALRITNNWIEEHDIAGVYLLNGSSQTASMAAINWNEFSNATLSAASRADFLGHVVIVSGAADWLTQAQVIGNIMRSTAAAASAGFIDIQSGTRVQVSGNNLEGLSGNTGYAIKVGAQADNLSVTDNMIGGTFSAGKYSLTSEVYFRDMDSNLTRADLPGACKDGSTARITDGKRGTSPIVAGSAGVIVVRRGGQWEDETSYSGRVPLLSGTVSSAATLDIVLGTFGADFDSYELELISMLPATDGAFPLLRFSTDGGSTFNAGASDYKYANRGVADDASVVSRTSSANTEIQLGSDTGVGNVSTEGISSTVKLMNVTSSSLWTRARYDSVFVDSNAGQRLWSVRGAGVRVAAQDTDAVRFLFHSGNIASGRYKLYGLR